MEKEREKRVSFEKLSTSKVRKEKGKGKKEKKKL
jgi:hypothetical protein